MGGRRPVSVAAILGPNRATGLERRLVNALRDQDTDRIASVSADLANKAATPEEIKTYFNPFIPFIKRQLDRAGPVDSREWRQEVRAEWSRIKRDQGIEVRSAVNDAVVQAVIDFLRSQGR